MYGTWKRYSSKGKKHWLWINTTHYLCKLNDHFHWELVAVLMLSRQACSEYICENLKSKISTNMEDVTVICADQRRLSVIFKWPHLSYHPPLCWMFLLSRWVPVFVCVFCASIGDQSRSGKPRDLSESWVKVNGLGDPLRAQEGKKGVVTFNRPALTGQGSDREVREDRNGPRRTWVGWTQCLLSAVIRPATH